VPVPLGETDLEPVGVEVDAKRDETEALEFRYGSVDIEEDIDCEYKDPRSFGSLNKEERLRECCPASGAKIWPCSAL